MNTITVFLAHNRYMDDARINVLCSAVEKSQSTPTLKVSCVSGRDDFRDRFSTAGSWEAWSCDVATGIDVNTRQSRYAAILVPELLTVGQATAKLVELALAAKKPVFFTKDGVTLQQVDRMDWINESWQEAAVLGFS